MKNTTQPDRDAARVYAEANYKEYEDMFLPGTDLSGVMRALIRGYSAGRDAATEVQADDVEKWFAGLKTTYAGRECDKCTMDSAKACPVWHPYYISNMEKWKLHHYRGNCPNPVEVQADVCGCGHRTANHTFGKKSCHIHNCPCEQFKPLEVLADRI